MSNTNMPAAEASELSSYELAFHVLPTVAEGEVATVFQSLKDTITKAGGVIQSEEAPARFALAYEITKYLEGRNRKFTSAYFGWVRFSTTPEVANAMGEDLAGVPELLRHLLVKLTKTEEENPFFFHDALDKSVVQTIDLDADDADEVVDEDVIEVVDTTEDAEDGEVATDKV